MDRIRSVAFALVFAAGLATPAALAAEAPKNLKILPKDMSRAQVKKLMKVVAKSLGVECEHCHDTDDFAKDTEKKEIARSMMRMVGSINKTYFKGKNKVGCITCHNGHKEPKSPG